MCFSNNWDVFVNLMSLSCISVFPRLRLLCNNLILFQIKIFIFFIQNIIILWINCHVPIISSFLYNLIQLHQTESALLPALIGMNHTLCIIFTPSTFLYKKKDVQWSGKVWRGIAITSIKDERLMTFQRQTWRLGCFFW